MYRQAFIINSTIISCHFYLVALQFLLNAINVTGLVVGRQAHNEGEHLETKLYAKATGTH